MTQHTATVFVAFQDVAETSVVPLEKFETILPAVAEALTLFVGTIDPATIDILPGEWVVDNRLIVEGPTCHVRIVSTMFEELSFEKLWELSYEGVLSNRLGDIETLVRDIVGPKMSVQVSQSSSPPMGKIV
jgi:hypothetical protein